jgi:hypothetical protein
MLEPEGMGQAVGGGKGGQFYEIRAPCNLACRLKAG